MENFTSMHHAANSDIRNAGPSGNLFYAYDDTADGGDLDWFPTFLIHQ